MARLLGDSAHLVSYGAMSKQPLSLPTSLFIFKNLTAHGFWQSRWYLDKPREEREQVMETLIDLMRTGRVRLTNISSWAVLTDSSSQFKEPLHEIVTISARGSDEAATLKVRDVITKLSSGHGGKKILLKLDSEGGEEIANSSE